MRILLINTNPVVSRLFKLAMVHDKSALDEVEKIEDIKQVDYQMVCVDDSAYSVEVQALIDTLEASSCVFISYGSKEMEGFDLLIKKPFLPTQISHLIEMLKQKDLNSEMTSNDTKILDTKEIEKIKTLLKMDDEAHIDDPLMLSEEGYEARKVEVIKEQLLSEGLHLIEEEDIVEAISEKKISSDESFLTESDLALFQKAFKESLHQMKPKKIKKFLAGAGVKIKLKLKDEE